MKLFRASFDTRHFVFEAYGQTEAEAREILHQTWETHVAGCRAAGDDVSGLYDWHDDLAEDVSIDEVALGCGYIDREEAYQTPGLVDQLDEIAKLKKILKPFAHDDLCKFTTQCTRLGSIVFGKDHAELKIRDFQAARAAIK